MISIDGISVAIGMLFSAIAESLGCTYTGLLTQYYYWSISQIESLPHEKQIVSVHLSTCDQWLQTPIA